MQKKPFFSLLLFCVWLSTNLFRKRCSLPHWADLTGTDKQRQIRDMKAAVTLHDLLFVPFLTEDRIQERVTAMGAALREKYADDAPVFLAILNGAFIFAADLVRACAMQSEITFIKLSSYQGLESTGQVITYIGLDTDLAGRHVIIVEDIVDSGETLHQFLPEVRRMKPASIAIAALLIKPAALRVDLKIDYVGFEIPTKFVVGYGLDYNGLGRDLRSIYQLADV